ncbi:MAG: metallophosphoesterase [Clostridiales bacterium]|nr:metallophosphoesterase [Clostridiales bacterium]
MLKTPPAVFAVEKEYQIMVQTTAPCLVFARVRGEEYFDDSNGILRSLQDIHRVQVPMEELDEAKEYTLCVRPLIERKPYFTTTEPLREYRFSFRPVPNENVRAYHISDAHNDILGPVAAAKAFGHIDLLILNGDVIDHSGDPSKFDNVYEICAQLTGGQIPVIFSRGNHDMRGNFAEKFADYTPSAQGKTYYSFRLGGIWGLLLDCGEDKPDSHDAYGHTICCHAFRRRQTRFLKEIIKNAQDEYLAPGVHTRMVISHNPFTEILESPFDIEQDLYDEWTALLREHVKPHLILCGHMHALEVRLPGHEKDHHGQPCPVVIGADPRQEGYAGCGLVLGKEKIDTVFTDSTGAAFGQARLEK